MRNSITLLVALAAGCAMQDTDTEPGRVLVGAASIDITPDYPVRLSGYGSRRQETSDVAQRIFAKALAIGEGPATALWVAVDNCGVPAAMTDELAAWLQEKHGIPRDRVVVTSTHTHSAPMLSGVLPNLFSRPIARDQLERIARYTNDLAAKLKEVAAVALDDRRPGRLAWARGKVTFAHNRRTPGGPVDHDLDTLRVTGTDGTLRAVVANYACHCTTLTGSFNKICGDWAGYAQEFLETTHEGAVALVTIGCAGDQNPHPRPGFPLARQHGRAIAEEVERLLPDAVPLVGAMRARYETIDLPFDRPPSRQEWEQRAERPGIVGYHARRQLERLGRGEQLQTALDYPIQTWCFGDDLAVVFLGGEVVIDYALRLKRELDGRRLVVTAYANDVPCYIPSERVLREGGYEAVSSLYYYDRPSKLQPGLENRVVQAVRELLPETYGTRLGVDPARTDGIAPRTPGEAQRAFRTRADLAVELVVAEPLVVDPVAIDFGPDGELWVAEMCDYPTGARGNYEPGGRIKRIVDADGDGDYDEATVFLDRLPFPTGVTAWGTGVLVCAAPEILYAEDTDGDGRADRKETLFTGFFTGNYQARVNSLTLGLDNWIYGACGLFGGRIKNRAGRTTDIGRRDFRMSLGGVIEPAAGCTQQGRARDDWGNWFGCDNSHLLLHFPLHDHWSRRNPHVAAPPSQVDVLDFENSSRVYPISRRLERFNHPEHADRVTGACGATIYRDDLLGEQYAGNAFVCESVHNTVHRLLLEARGSTYSARRAADEQRSEFLASSDNWFRPVQARTGPDGALWIVDMYRFVIEHPRWIPPRRQEALDLRAGSTMGRIWRVVPKERALRRVPRLGRADAPGLLTALESPNGTLRDLAQQLLVQRRETGTATALARLARDGARPVTRLHAICTLDGLGQLEDRIVAIGLEDPHPGVRRHAIRLGAGRPTLFPRLLPLVRDSDPQLRLQLACTLGECDDPRAADALVELLSLETADAWLAGAVLSSAIPHVDRLVSKISWHNAATPRRIRLGLAKTLGAVGRTESIRGELSGLLMRGDAAWNNATLESVAALLDGVRTNRRARVEDVPAGVAARARAIAFGKNVAADRRALAVELLSRLPGQVTVASLLSLLEPQTPIAVQRAAVAALCRRNDTGIADRLLDGWRERTPAIRSVIVDALLQRRTWTERLLERFRTERIPALDPARRAILLRRADPSTRALARRLLARSTNPRRAQVIERYRSVLARPGSHSRGARVFAQACAKCHRLDGVGQNLGPDLAAMTDRSPQALLIGIFDPNRAVLDRHETYVVMTRDERVCSGMVLEETSNSIRLADADGNKHTILRRDIETLDGTGLSYMPEGLENQLTEQDVADLLTYLGRAGAAPRSFAGNTPRRVKSDSRGRYALPATDCEIHGDQIRFEPEFRNIGYWHSAGDRVVWELDVARAGRFDVWLDWACANRAENSYVLEGTATPLRGRAATTGSWAVYRQAKIGTIVMEPGARRLVMRPDEPVVGALLDLRGLWLVPAGGASPFRQ